MNSILDFDPNGSYPLDELLNIPTLNPPKDFNAFWQRAYQQTLAINPTIELRDTGNCHEHWKIYDLYFQSTNSVKIGGWLLVPANHVVQQTLIVAHGYGGREGPDFHLPFPNAAIFFPCARGISRSAKPPISQQPYWHVIHDVDKKNQYILKGCVEDLWLSVSVLETLYPHLINKTGLIGNSFGGGIGILALAQDKRIAKAHFNVPTFGNHKLRLRIPTTGSGKSLQDFYRKEPYKLIRTIRYYDAAFAASAITVPVHFALALRDPMVTPPGQFAIYNQINSNKQLYVLDAGHDSYPTQEQQNKELMEEVKLFFT